MSNELMVLQTQTVPPTITDNLAELKIKLENELSQYKQVPVTVATLTDAKKSLADLRKALSAFEDKRKSIKNEINKPYDDWLISYYSALSALTDLINSTDTQIKAVENELAEQKKKDIQEMLDERFGMQPQSVQEFADSPWVWMGSWKNKGDTLDKIAKDIDEIIKGIIDALAFIAKDPAHTPQLVERFRQYGSLSDLFRYEDDLKSQDFRAQKVREDQEAARIRAAQQQAAERAARAQRQAEINAAAQQRAAQASNAPAPAPAPVQAQQLEVPKVKEDLYVINIEHPANNPNACKVIRYTMRVTAPAYVIAAIKKGLESRKCIVERVGNIEFVDQPTNNK